MLDFDRFARFYDLDFEDCQADVDLYLNLARRTGSPLLEIGCGTGRLLAPLAKAGFAVTGVDISAAMLAIAAKRVSSLGLADGVTLSQADAASFRLSGRFELAFCAANTFMHFTTVDLQLRVLGGVADHLRPGGLFVVDLFNPDPVDIAARDTVMCHDYTKLDPASGHLVSKYHVQHLDLAEQQLDVTFFYDDIAPDGTVQRAVAPFPMHYFWRRELVLLFERAGLIVERVYGDYDLDEYAADSPRLIAVATKP